MFLITRQTDVQLEKVPLWIDDTPTPQRHGRKSTLLLALLARAR